MIFLIAGHHNKDTGAVYSGLVEANLTKELRDLIAKNLDDLKVKYVKDNDSKILSQIVGWVNGKGKPTDIVFDIHFNSSDNTFANGVECFIPLRPSNKEKGLAHALVTTTASTLEIKNRGVKLESESARGRLAILSTTGTNVLLETCFISNKKGMDSYNKLKDVLAKKIASVLKSYEEIK